MSCRIMSCSLDSPATTSGVLLTTSCIVSRSPSIFWRPELSQNRFKVSVCQVFLFFFLFFRNSVLCICPMRLFFFSSNRCPLWPSWKSKPRTDKKTLVFYKRGATTYRKCQSVSQRSTSTSHCCSALAALLTPLSFSWGLSSKLSNRERNRVSDLIGDLLHFSGTVVCFGCFSSNLEQSKKRFLVKQMRSNEGNQLGWGS